MTDKEKLSLEFAGHQSRMTDGQTTALYFIVAILALAIFVGSLGYDEGWFQNLQSGYQYSSYINAAGDKINAKCIDISDSDRRCVLTDTVTGQTFTMDL